MTSSASSKKTNQTCVRSPQETNQEQINKLKIVINKLKTPFGKTMQASLSLTMITFIVNWINRGNKKKNNSYLSWRRRSLISHKNSLITTLKLNLSTQSWFKFTSNGICNWSWRMIDWSISCLIGTQKSVFVTSNCKRGWADTSVPLLITKMKRNQCQRRLRKKKWIYNSLRLNTKRQMGYGIMKI